MVIQEQGGVVALTCRACKRSFVPNMNQVKREQMIVCPHCKAHYMPPARRKVGERQTAKPS